VGLDNGWDGYLDDLIDRFALPGARRRHIELPLTDVDCVGENLMNTGDPKSLAPASSIAIAIEPFDDFLDAKGTRGAVVVKIKLVDEACGEFILRRENIIAPGNSGTGKTHVALALGLAACQKGFPSPSPPRPHWCIS
jgi:hypothetical protein